MIKATYDKPTGNIIVNSETLKDFPLRREDRYKTGMLFNRYKISGEKKQFCKMNNF